MYSDPIEWTDDTPLIDRWKDVYYGRAGPKNLIMSNHFASAYFMLMAFTMLYNFIVHIVPSEFSSATDWERYWLKVVVVAVFIQTMANWLCVRLISTNLKGTKDVPYSSRTMHEDPILPRADHPNYCQRCKIIPPPNSKSHHCRDCDQCIARRDHHCYLVGKCIGYYNQRYFVVLCFYVAFASIVGIVYTYRYMERTTLIREDLTRWDFFIPVSFYDVLIGQLQPHELFMILHCYTLWWTSILGVGFFLWQMAVISQGLTTREFRKNARARHDQTLSANFRSVFGPFWACNFLVPCQLVFRQAEIEQPLLIEP